MFKKIIPIAILLLVAIGVFLMNQLNQPPQVNQGDGKLRVVATTTIIGDVVRQIAGDIIDLTVLIPVGADVHGFEPVPQELALLSEADVVFVNGFQFEEDFFEAIESIESDLNLVSVSEGIVPRQFETDDEDHHNVDPHVWMNPQMIVQWIINIKGALSNLDSSNATRYEENATHYEKSLIELDEWIEVQVANIPQEDRELVMDHDAWGYLADRYGLTIVGAVLPSFSNVGEPSAQEVAAIIDAVRAFDVKAIFIGITANLANTQLAQQVADETGIQLVDVMTGSLGESDNTDTYIEYMRFNVNRLIEALK